MVELVKAIRGMNDILPDTVTKWQYLEQCLRDIASQYGYQEIRFPMLEKTELFKRTIGEVTDIVEKEMYTFVDRNGESLSLRPEGTACCVRACLEHGLLYQQTQRLWYMGPMFRHERPQQGRFRQFFQFGLEAFGMDDPDIDAEILALCARIWSRLGLNEHIFLKLNSLGNKEARVRYREVLVTYFEHHREALDEDSQRRLTTNPMRILDSKNKEMEDVIRGAPRLIDYIDNESRTHFEKVQSLLDSLKIPFTVDPCLVRGLDYYTKTVFEWQTERLGSQNAVCAGGRYDGLVAELGGKPTSAAGFAMGLERLLALMDTVQLETREPTHADVYLVGQGADVTGQLLQLAEVLRSSLPQLKIVQNCGDASFKAQFKRADKSGARYALILGETEIAAQKIGVKDLRNQEPQALLGKEELIDFLQYQYGRGKQERAT
jgi:histidyl-tRNA synthetase